MAHHALPDRPRADLPALHRPRARRPRPLSPMGSARMNGIPALSILTALPAAGAVLILLLSARRNLNPRFARFTALIISLLALFFVHILWHHFDVSTAAYQFQEIHPWIPALNVDYHLGIDGIGLLMLLAA